MRTFGLSEFLFIVQAAQWTLALSAIAFVGGALLGLVVALSRTSENAAARNAARVFIQVFQGTPLPQVTPANYRTPTPNAIQPTPRYTATPSPTPAGTRTPAPTQPGYQSPPTITPGSYP